jgi:hypothetical protein
MLGHDQTGLNLRTNGLKSDFPLPGFSLVSGSGMNSVSPGTGANFPVFQVSKHALLRLVRLVVWQSE